MVKQTKKSKSTKNTKENTQKKQVKGKVKHESHAKHNKTSKKNYTKYFVSAAVLIVIVAAILLINYLSSSNQQKDAIAYINGVPITGAQLQSEINKLPAGSKDSVTKKDALSQLIDKKLLLVEANKYNIDIDKEVQNVMDKNSMNQTQFESVLSSQGLSVQDFKEQLRILIFLNDTIFKGITTTDEEVQSFYDSNPSFFVTPETVVAKHILISTANRTDEEALNLINEIKAKFDANNSDFCDLVTEYSEDPGSVKNCGEYPAFSMNDNFVQEYKEAAFANKVGEARIAKTQFGYHLIWTIKKNPESVLSLDDVKKEVKNAIIVQKQQQAFTDYVATLRSKADIVNCYTTPDDKMCGGTGVTANTSVSQTDLASFAQCITQKGAKMYGASWCTHCAAQKKMFGDAFKNVNYVECAQESNPQAQTPACQAAGIQGYPTWEVGGQKYPGEITLEKLSQLTGCTL